MESKIFTQGVLYPTLWLIFADVGARSRTCRWACFHRKRSLRRGGEKCYKVREKGREKKGREKKERGGEERREAMRSFFAHGMLWNGGREGQRRERRGGAPIQETKIIGYVEG